MEEKIYQFIYTSLNDNIHFDKSANLIEEQIINSMGFLSFINFLEDEFNVEIELDEVSEDNFSTIEDIAYFVKKRQVEHYPDHEQTKALLPEHNQESERTRVT